MIKKLFEIIDKLTPKYLKFWEDICNMETPTMDKPRIDAFGEFFIEIAKEKGFKYEVFESVTGNVVTLTMNPNAKKPPICLSAHMDTVHPVGSLGNPAVKIVGDKIYGPGVTDCKGGFAVSMLAIEALKEIDFQDRPVMLILQSDEEAGSRPINKPTINYICEKAKGSRAFFNLEGAKKGFVCVERKGIVTYTVKINGVEAHSSSCAKLGASAILEASHKIIELEKFKDHDGITCCCGVINGGTTHNTVPGYCEFRANFRFKTDSQFKEIQNFMNELESKVYVSGTKTTVEEYGSRPAMEYVERNIELLDTINKIFTENGLSTLEPYQAVGGSDAAQVTMAGIPCLDNLGVVGDNIHNQGEYAEIYSLNEYAKRLASIICCID